LSGDKRLKNEGRVEEAEGSAKNAVDGKTRPSRSERQALAKYLANAAKHSIEGIAMDLLLLLIIVLIVLSLAGGAFISPLVLLLLIVVAVLLIGPYRGRRGRL
jgi:hypothetical protein